MDKVFSARLDQAVLDEMDRVTRKLRMTKKQFLEEAIRVRARQLARGDAEADWADAFGAWARTESAEATRRRSRRAFQTAIRKHHKR